jgi:hypothetical protein
MFFDMRKILDGANSLVSGFDYTPGDGDDQNRNREGNRERNLATR